MAKERNNNELACLLPDSLAKRREDGSGHFRLPFSFCVMIFHGCVGLAAFIFIFLYEKSIIAFMSHASTTCKLLYVLGSIIYLLAVPGFIFGFKSLFNNYIFSRSNCWRTIKLIVNSSMAAFSNPLYVQLG